MKIGILTYHRTLNYGACLQAVATRVALEKLGFEAYYVDYWPEYHSRSYKAFSWKKLVSLSFKKGLLYLAESFNDYKFRKQRICNFDEFFANYINPYSNPLWEKYDVIIYGSDQIWRKQSALNAYNPIYFGKNNLSASKHIAYSASMGLLPTDEIDREVIKELVSNLDRIAVREQNLMELLESMGYHNIALTLDPTLLFTSKEWDEIIPTETEEFSRYVLVYSINKVPFDMTKIREFARIHGCKVKVLCGTASSKEAEDIITTANPIKFISLIKNAEYVFTSSFHGLVFSIIYHKDFLTLYKKNSNRAQTLLDSLDIKDRIAKDNDIPMSLPSIDYAKVEDLLKRRRHDSYNYLLEAINN